MISRAVAALRWGWTFADAKWRAAKPNEAALVACLSAPRDDLIETCYYTTATGRPAFDSPLR